MNPSIKKLLTRSSRVAITNRNAASIKQTGRFEIMKNRAVRTTKTQPPIIWMKCFVCNKDLWTNRQNFNVYDRCSSPPYKRYIVCNSQKCLNMLIFQIL